VHDGIERQIVRIGGHRLARAQQLRREGQAHCSLASAHASR
jgi:hypothetical protein